MRVSEDGSTNTASEVMGEATRESVARDLEHDNSGSTEDVSVGVEDALEGDLSGEAALPGPLYEINESDAGAADAGTDVH